MHASTLLQFAWETPLWRKREVRSDFPPIQERGMGWNPYWLVPVDPDSAEVYTTSHSLIFLLGLGAEK
ncbi:MAG: hypothetical protein COU10_03930 [Candidatus Harrisonbacteria bacterium CG10_big_fil_rev_8_21_14_0_10_45_28]|uniref:Uncharacterized protein n=1 Tax=Candidatus Harrisonbacteria bacterium CG10_big_fil_rev_8_21_14_0_10_45_28 TaxID=1974586 RepID=A0A2H0UME6_9BACT|nr:MAG: hypothetical protein COU10_03930 [Candidatus Harrisonbacteria bacterium CG10_big_fil_rev_8_21_14_0_10_45_28]